MANESERLAALERLQIIRSERLPEYDALVETLADVFGCPIAFLGFFGAQEQWFKARVGLDLDSTPRENSICEHTLSSDDLLVLPDVRADGRFKDMLPMIGDTAVRFYAGCPLSVDGKNRLGSICVIDSKPMVPSDDQLKQLRRLGRIAEGLIKSHQARLEAKREHLQATREGELLEEIANISGVGGWEYDCVTDTLSWSGKTREIHEVGPDFVPDLNFSLSCFAPAGRHVLSEAMNKAKEVGAGWDVELPFTTAKGRKTWVRAAGRAIFEGGSVVRLVGAYQDITGRKVSEHAVRQSEAIHRTTLEALSEGILLLSRTGLIQSFNPAAAKLLGFDGAELRGKKVGELGLVFQCEQNCSGVDCNPLQSAAEKPDEVQNVVALVSRGPGGKASWLLINSKAVTNTSDFGLDGVVVSLTDIGESKRQADILQIVVENTPGGVVYFDEHRRIAAFNEDFRRMLQLPQHLFEKKATLLEVAYFLAKRGDYGPGSPEDLVREQFDYFDHPEPHVYERLSPQGTVFEIRNTPLPNGGLVSSYFDVTERKNMERQLAENERQARARSEEFEIILANMRQGVSVFDRKGRLALWNKQYLEIFGKSDSEVRQGMTLAELIAVDKQKGTFTGEITEHVSEVMGRLNDGDPTRSVYRHPSGKIISVNRTPLPAGGWIATSEDVTSRELAAEKIQHAAHHDTLTGLANRTLFNLKLNEALCNASERGDQGYLLLLDLDQFKPVNDSFGHDIGDDLLKQVSSRLRKCVRSSDLVARIGGDEFAIILFPTEARSDDTNAADIAGRVVRAIQAPFGISDFSISIGVSVGIATITAATVEARVVIKQADIALYEVKKHGRNGFQFYDASTGEATTPA
ncbi:PAS-domain containing protein [Roseibium aggregatum]|uniref:PAS-domain containing protein n=1 Tax=Roseibium aggregatum TaxID=187304 RepID=A0A939J6K0_9HYPH|nr:PAS-domain containing protein [Roseibium aggregatum]MBN9672869.1 PAS-domain containing protein [Roseibium aggregatum]